jgi:hypothetical protein
MERLMIGLALLCFANTAAADDLLLKRLVGEWIGRGMVQLNAAAEPERLYCKITNALSPDGASLHQTGRCALPTNSVAVQAELQALGAGRYSGSANRRGAPAAATFSGTARANQIVLTAETTASKTKATATATIDLADNGFRIKAVRVDPKTNTPYTVSEVVFLPE